MCLRAVDTGMKAPVGFLERADTEETGMFQARFVAPRSRSSPRVERLLASGQLHSPISALVGSAPLWIL